MSDHEGIERCARCILPASLPSARLDEEGICIHCRTFEASYGNWEEERERRKRKLEQILEEARSCNRPYDCLIPLSGGKDSTYALYIASRVYGLRCLTVTFDNGYLSRHAQVNIRNAISAAGADHIMYTPDRDNLLRTYRHFIQKSGDFCSVCMKGINTSAVSAAKAFDVPLTINGNGERIGYLNMMWEVFQWGDSEFFRKVIAESTDQRMLALFGAVPCKSGTDMASGEKGLPRRALLKLMDFTQKVQRRLRRMLEYPHLRKLRYGQTIGIFDYLDVSREQLEQTLKEEMGWTRPEDRSEHMDCLLHEMPFYIQTRKFPELTPNTLYRCGLIRRGLLTREEALREDIQERKTPVTPEILDSFLDEMEMGRDAFSSAVQDWSRIEKYRRPR